ncbi:MAG TPA: response regulator transcription factor, partial [Blastocatellia bacterium]|nr:response regulator transcription factor [Blastocatellia bacterium]
MPSSGLNFERESPLITRREPQSASPVRILLIEPLATVRAGLQVLLENQSFLSLVGAVGSRRDGLAIAAQEHPNLILVDMDLVDSCGLELIPELLAAAENARVLILAGENDEAAYQRVVTYGAIGIILKEQIAGILLAAIEKANAGKVWNVLSQLTNSRRHEQPDPEEARIATLTIREREVINLVGLALRNKAIAERLFISEATV